MDSLGLAMKQRCQWCNDDPIYQDYHDNEWGQPEHDDRTLFELLILEGAQAGLSWITVLKKRDNYRKAFDDFDVNKVAGYDAEKVSELLLDKGIIRNKLKVNSAVKNAKAFIEIQKEYGTFDNYIWSYVDHNPVKNHFSEMSELPSKTDLSDQISKDLKKRGMSFVGSTIIYAYMQSIGLVNDHTQHCYLYAE